MEALVLTQEEWRDLSHICHIYAQAYSGQARPLAPGPERELILCERIIEACT